MDVYRNRNQANQIKMSNPDHNNNSEVLLEDKVHIEEPPMYKVMLHNDDYTTMDFVIMVLETVFHKKSGEAAAIMLNVHKQGLGLAGIYTREIADTKVHIVHDLARQNEFPLRCSMEKA